MDSLFFEHPILNPYCAYPALLWELDTTWRALTPAITCRSQVPTRRRNFLMI